MDCQVYAYDGAGRLTHAGIFQGRLTTARVKRHQQTWEQWRLRYLLDNPGDYPLRRSAPTMCVCAHPVGDPTQRIYVDIPFR